MKYSSFVDVNFMVCVRCATFNHAPYIEDAMNGFCMQQTNFPFVCVIVDDASTDGEQEVIRTYLQKHFDLEDDSLVRNEETENYIYYFARHKTNHNCFFAVYYLKYNHYSIKKSKAEHVKEWKLPVKYIALCEGDDYWIYPQKLQKQVEFMDANEDYGLCFTEFNIRFHKEDIIVDSLFRNFPNKYQTVYTLSSWILKRGYVAPMTWLCRASLLESFTRIPSVDGTFVLFANFLAYSKVHCLKDDATAFYRVLTNSASHSSDLQKLYTYQNGLRKTQIELVDLFQTQIPDYDNLKQQINLKSFKNIKYLWLMVSCGDEEEYNLYKYVCGKNHSFLSLFFIIPIFQRFAFYSFKFFRKVHWLFYKNNIKRKIK